MVPKVVGSIPIARPIFRRSDFSGLFNLRSKTASVILMVI